jgi:EAL domain-containing protein (putative c-di-GMP-specific phosphodiesterase class I)
MADRAVCLFIRIWWRNWRISRIATVAFSGALMVKSIRGFTAMMIRRIAVLRQPSTALRARRALELDLRNALAASEFERYYQPLVTLETGCISGFEALLRWHHPLRGMVAPTEFIPLAEEIGLIVPLGEWVLRQACAEAVSWPGDLKVAVNLSPVQFKNGDLTEVVFAALASAGLPAARLELEVTESLLLAVSETNLATLHRMRGLGVCISMDDFGTGYSGMSNLRAFPFNKIKIDRSFVSELGESGDCMAIVRAPGSDRALAFARRPRGRNGKTTRIIAQRGLHRNAGLFVEPAEASERNREFFDLARWITAR